MNNIHTFPLVSVAMATYNGELFLQQQLDSIIDQTYKNIELVISDDCSIDKTKEILLAFNEKYNSQIKIKLFFNESNIGFIKNFEKALTYCEGDFIALCDQDDIWKPQKIAHLLAEIGEYSLIYSDVSLINADGSIISASRTIDDRINNHSDISFSELMFKNYITGCAAMFRKDILNSALPIPKEALFHDWWVAIFASKSKGIKYLHEPLVLYRQHDKNVYGVQQGGFIKNIVNTLMRSTKKTNEFTDKLNHLKLFDNFNGLNEYDIKAIATITNYYKSYSENKCLLQHWVLTLLLYRKLSVKKSRMSLFLTRLRIYH